MFLLAQQIGPMLAEGSKGNPRQIKRFLNAMLIRQAIARARGFGDAVNRAVLAKLMLAERFQPDFYEHIAGQAMVAEDGAPPALKGLEERAAKKEETEVTTKKTTKKAEAEAGGAGDAEEREAKWLERDLSLPKISSDLTRPDSEGCDMIRVDARNIESTVVGPCVAIQVTCLC